MNTLACPVEIVGDPEAFRALEPEWDRLYARADRPYLTQSFEWNLCCWESFVKPAGGRLRCVVVRAAGNVVLIWPFAVTPYHRFWRVARSLATGAGDYCAALVEPGPEAGAWTAAAWKALCRKGGADLVFAERVRDDSPLVALFESPRFTVTDPDRAFSVTGKDYASWAAYARQLPGRETLDRASRRLAKLGAVTFERVETPEAKAACLAWLLMRKAEQLREKGYQPAWGNDSSRLEAFMKRASTRVRRFGALDVYALRVGTELAAVQAVTRDADHLLVFQLVYAPAYKKYGPGTLLTRHIVHEAFEHRLIFDLLWGGNAENKKVFCNREMTLSSRLYPRTGWGRLALLLRDRRRRHAAHGAGPRGLRLPTS